MSILRFLKKEKEDPWTFEQKEKYLQYKQSIGTYARFLDGFDPHSFRTFRIGLKQRIGHYWGKRRYYCHNIIPGWYYRKTFKKNLNREDCGEVFEE